MITRIRQNCFEALQHAWFREIFEDLPLDDNLGTRLVRSVDASSLTMTSRSSLRWAKVGGSNC